MCSRFNSAAGDGLSGRQEVLSGSESFWNPGEEELQLPHPDALRPQQLVLLSPHCYSSDINSILFIYKSHIYNKSSLSFDIFILLRELREDK